MTKLKKNILIILLLVLFLIIGFVYIYKKSLNTKDYVTFDSRIQNVKESDFNKTTTVYGWIQVEGTNIDYPVVKETEYVYSSNIDYIWRVNKYIEGENRQVISGHNILNISNKPLIADPNHTRFEQLMSFVDYDFARKNLYIQYTQDGKDELYKIYAVGFIDASSDEGNSLEEDEVDDYIKKAREESIYDYDVSVNSKDEIISLITCTRYFGINGKTQFRVDARKIRKNEKIKKYNVERNKNYDIIK